MWIELIFFILLIVCIAILVYSRIVPSPETRDGYSTSAIPTSLTMDPQKWKWYDQVSPAYMSLGEMGDRKYYPTDDPVGTPDYAVKVQVGEPKVSEWNQYSGGKYRNKHWAYIHRL